MALNHLSKLLRALKNEKNLIFLQSLNKQGIYCEKINMIVVKVAIQSCDRILIDFGGSSCEKIDQ